MGTTPSDTDRREPASPEPCDRFVAIVSERADGEELCSISPVPTTERRLDAVWVSARDDSFVALEEMR